MLWNPCNINLFWKLSANPLRLIDAEHGGDTRAQNLSLPRKKTTNYARGRGFSLTDCRLSSFNFIAAKLWWTFHSLKKFFLRFTTILYVQSLVRVILKQLYIVTMRRIFPVYLSSLLGTVLFTTRYRGWHVLFWSFVVYKKI
jgi:hypothetical protein